MQRVVLLVVSPGSRARVLVEAGVSPESKKLSELVLEERRKKEDWMT